MLPVKEMYEQHVARGGGNGGLNAGEQEGFEGEAKKAEGGAEADGSQVPQTRTWSRPTYEIVDEEK